MNNDLISERVLSILEWDSVVLELAKRCKTPPGRAYALSLSPLSVDRIKIQQKIISELKELMEQNESPEFNGIEEIKPQIEMAAKGGTLSLDDLFSIKNFIIASGRLVNYINGHKENLQQLSRQFGGLHKLKEAGDLIIPSITDNGELNEKRFPELKKIRASILSLKQEIEKRLNKIIHNPSIEKSLQEKIYTTRNDRYVLLVKTEMKGALKGTVHDVSSSGATMYIEPEAIVQLNNRLIMERIELQMEMTRILKSLSRKAGDHSNELLYNLKRLAYLDFISAASNFSISIRGNGVEITDEYIIRLYSVRHPLLYLMLGDKAIANDIFLGEDHNCLIISGANTGGKTVMLKTMGLCTLLAIHGLHLPAGPDSKIGRFDEILADIGDDQSITRSLSSYSGQIVILSDMIKKAGRGTLVLIDEIIASTDPRQGAALSRAILESLILSDARIVVTTHYPELKELAAADKRFQNASVSFDMESLRPTYNFNSGIPGASYAFEIAETYGISKKIIARSKELMDERHLSGEALLENLEKHRQEIEDEKYRIKELTEQATREKQKYLDMQSKMKIAMEEIKNERGIDFIDDLKRYQKEIDRKIKETRPDDIKTLTSLKKNITNKQKDTANHLRKESPKRFRRNYIPFDSQEAKNGDPVFVVPLEKEGKIESIDRHNGSVLIILGNSIRTRYPFGDLMTPMGRAGGTGENTRAKKIENPSTEKGVEPVPQTMQTRYNTVDLRGLTVDEAIKKMEQDFDGMVRNGISSAVVIHGHGTGALKEGVRSSLRHSFYAKEFRPGEQGEGGDGVTIVMLRV